jgi:abequosyltransferase
MKKNLSISIPTYNRKNILIENLTKIIKIKDIERVDIFIFDDGNDGLELDMAEIIQDNKFIFYIKNEKNHGHDENIKRALSYPDSSYVWLLGDSMYFGNEYFGEIIKLIDAAVYDAVILDNNQGRIKNHNINNPYSEFEFYENMAWHCTLTGVVIYSKKVIDAGLIELSKINYKNFIQYAILFLGLNRKSLIYVLNNKIVYKNNKRSSSYWVQKPFEVFAIDWTNVNLSFVNKFGKKMVDNVVLSHSINTGIFNGKMLIYLKAHHGINISNYSKLNDLEKKSVNNNSILFKIILRLPDKLFHPFLLIYKIYKKFILK